MSAGPELRLRAALRELSDVPPPADPAGAALARAGRDRRRSGLLVAGVAVGVAVAVAVPTAVLRDGPGTVPVPAGTAAAPAAGPPPPGRPAARRQVVSAYNYVDDDMLSAVLDPSTGGYVPLDAHVDLSPDGRRVAVGAEWDGESRLGIADRTALLRDGLDAVRWLDRRVPWDGRAKWSPDGKRLLLTAGIKTGPPLRAYVVDGDTGAVLRELRFPSISEPPALAFSWSPDGREIFLPTSWGAVQFFDLTGRPTRRWQGLGTDVTGWWSGSSPSGRLLALETIGAGPDTKSAVVVETGTGRVVARLPEPARGPARPAGGDGAGRGVVRRGAPAAAASHGGRGPAEPDTARAEPEPLAHRPGVPDRRCPAADDARAGRRRPAGTGGLDGAAAGGTAGPGRRRRAGGRELPRRRGDGLLSGGERPRVGPGWPAAAAVASGNGDLSTARRRCGCDSCGSSGSPRTGRASCWRPRPATRSGCRSTTGCGPPAAAT